jgi:hypothetical protein
VGLTSAADDDAVEHAFELEASGSARRPGTLERRARPRGEDAHDKRRVLDRAPSDEQLHSRVD